MLVIARSVLVAVRSVSANVTRWKQPGSRSRRVMGRRADRRRAGCRSCIARRLGSPRGSSGQERGIELWSIIVPRVLTLSSAPRRRAPGSGVFAADALIAGLAAAVNVFLAYEGLVGLGELGELPNQAVDGLRARILDCWYCKPQLERYPDPLRGGVSLFRPNVMQPAWRG